MFEKKQGEQRPRNGVTKSGTSETQDLLLADEFGFPGLLVVPFGEDASRDEELKKLWLSARKLKTHRPPM